MNKFLAKYILFYPVVFLRNENVYKYLKSYEKTQWYEEKKLKGIQSKKLERLLKYSTRYVPYYKSFVNLEDKPVEYFKKKKIPFLTKEIIKKKKSDLISVKRKFFTTVKTTGGSTGEPVTILKDAKSMAKERAALWRGFSWAKIDIGDKQVRFWGIPFRSSEILKAKLIDFINNRYRVSAFDFDEKDLYQYYSEISRFKPSYFYGYVSLIKIFGQFMNDHNLEFPFRLKCIITTAEELTIADRESIEQNFKCRVFNEYGSGEIGTIAHECDRGKLHVNTENVYLEILNENGGNCLPGETGEIVITELNNYLFPLIRYRIGDLGAFDKENCHCGRGLPVLKGVYGRAYDVIETPEGKRYHPAFFNYVLKELKNRNFGVKQLQVIQTGTDTLLFNLVTDPDFNENAFGVTRKIIAERMSPNLVVQFERLDKIPREKSGKFRLVKALAS